jgi:hypothetical protein
MTGYYSSIDPDVRIGYFEWFHSNGRLRHKGNYSDNKEIGEHIWYFENGNVEAIENYSLGKLDGIYKEYYESGKISTETQYKNGLQDGFTKFYREDGSLHSEGNYKEGDRNGLWKYYNESGELTGTSEFKTEYEIPEANMFLKLPNSKWSLTDKKEGNVTEYYFKRDPITDKNGNKIIPAIMVFVEDATQYKQDATLYTIWKRRPFQEKGVNIDQTLIQENKEYPLTYKNAYFMKGSYNSNGFDHIIFMIHIINKKNKGIQIYLDMTKDLAEEYEQEFWTTIRSIKEL